MNSLSNDEKLMIFEAAPDVTVDTEGMEHMMGFSFAVDGMNQGFYLPFRHHQGNLTEVQIKKVRELIASRDSLIMHNAMHDLVVLEREGLPFKGYFWDTMLMAHWINEEMFAYDLSTVSTHYGNPPKNMPDHMKDLLSMDGWEAVPVAWMDEYSSNDSFITHRTWRQELPLFEEQGFTKPQELFNGQSLWEREQEFIRLVILPMKQRGIRIDIPFCIKEYMKGKAIMDECIKEIGFKPSSPKALENFLINELKLPVLARTKTGRISFNKDAMAEYDMLLEKKDDKRAQTILRYRGWQKTTSSNYKPYMELIDSEGILHPGYNLHRTVTSRLSCSEPNLQQIPKASEKEWNGKLKQAFIPREGFGLWTVDYSQLQFRMTVCMSEEPTLLEIFLDKSRDIFSEMAKQMAWLRDDVKTLVYLILFGGGGKRAKVAFGVTEEQGRELVNEFHSTYPSIKKLSKRAENAARRQGYVALWTGRRRHFPRGSAYYRALNAVIQGGEAEIIKTAMILVAKEICDENCYLVLQIHDELAFEIREGMENEYLPRIQEKMEEACEGFIQHVGTPMTFTTSAKKWGEK